MKRLKILLSFLLLFSVAQAQKNPFSVVDKMYFRYNNLHWIKQDSFAIFGMSIPAGFDGTNTLVDSSFITRFYRKILDSGYNHSVGGTTALDAYLQYIRYAAIPHKSGIIVMAGRNQYTSNTANLTYNTVINSYKAIWAISHLNYYYSAWSSAYVTKYGTWIKATQVGINNYHELLSNEGAQTSTINDSAVYQMQFNDSTIVFSVRGLFTGGTFDYQVDNGTVIHTTTNGATETTNTKNVNINRSGTAVCPLTYFITGLSYGKHSLKIINTAASALCIDYVGHLIDERFSYPFLFSHDVAYGATGFSGLSNDTLVHSNWKVDSLNSNGLAPGYPFWSTDTVPVNNGFNNGTMTAGDGIHLNQNGNRYLDTIYTNTYLAHFPSNSWYARGGRIMFPRQADPYHPMNVDILPSETEISKEILPTTFRWNQTVNTNLYSILWNGAGPSGGNGQNGSKSYIANIVINDSTSGSVNFLEGAIPGSNLGIIKGLRGKISQMVLGINIGTYGTVDGTHGGVSFLLDAANTGTTANPVLLINGHAPGGGNVNSARLWMVSTTQGQWQWGDSSNVYPGLIPVAVPGSLAMRFPVGTDAQRPGTNQQGYGRFNSTRLRWEVHDGAAYQQYGLDDGHTFFVPTTGQTITLINNQYNIVNPAGTIAALTITFPASPRDHDKVKLKFTQAVTTITWTGGTPPAAPTTATLGTYLEFYYDLATTTWL